MLDMVPFTSVQGDAGSLSDTGRPRISRHTMASRSCAGVYRRTAVWSAASCLDPRVERGVVRLAERPVPGPRRVDPALRDRLGLGVLVVHRARPALDLVSRLSTCSGSSSDSRSSTSSSPTGGAGSLAVAGRCG